MYVFKMSVIRIFLVSSSPVRHSDLVYGETGDVGKCKSLKLSNLTAEIFLKIMFSFYFKSRNDTAISLTLITAKNTLIRKERDNVTLFRD